MATNLFSSTHSSLGTATGTNGDGSVIVGYWAAFPYDDPTTFEPFEWTNVGGTKALGLGGYSYGAAQAISADGHVAVGVVGGYPARWVDLGSPTMLSGTTSGTAWAASQNGSVIVGTTGFNGGPTGSTTSALQQAFIWTAANGLRLLQDIVGTAPSGNIMFATGISADGKTVAGYGIQPTSGYSRGWIAVLP